MGRAALTARPRYASPSGTFAMTAPPGGAADPRPPTRTEHQPVSDRHRRPAPGHRPGSVSSRRDSNGSLGSRGPSGSPRHGRREVERPRPEPPATPNLLDQLRKPFLVSFVVFVATAAVLVLWSWPR